jgi:hypothetical protein
MQLEQQLREALQRDAAELVPVGRGPEQARRRAFRRKRRLQSGVVVLGAVGLAGGTLAVVESRPAGPGARVQSQPTAALDLQWRTVPGTVAVQGLEFTSPSGVTYALSTAPGPQPAGANTPPPALYSTRDGVTWTQASLGSDPWIADLAEGNGVLYAVGTGPGSQSGSVDFQLSTSANGGDQWTTASLPVQFSAPQSTVALTASDSVHVARGPHTTVVMAKVSYDPDVSSVIGANTPYNVTPDGVQVIDNRSCKSKLALTVPSGAQAQAQARALAAQAHAQVCTPTVVATHPWSDFGITDPAALQQQEVLVRDDRDSGGWGVVILPSAADSVVQDVTATSNGFLMVEELQPTGIGASNVAQLWSSTDGRTWTQMPGPVPTFDTASISGDRILGVNSQTAAISVSADAGATWLPTDITGLLPAGTQVQPGGLIAAAGPLGYAVTVQTGTPGGAGPTYLLQSSDGVNWSVSDLAADGAPANGLLSSVSVGADHLDISYDVQQGTGSDGAPVSYKLVELLGTPKAP